MRTSLSAAQRLGALALIVALLGVAGCAYLIPTERPGPGTPQTGQQADSSSSSLTRKQKEKMSQYHPMGGRPQADSPWRDK